jgi:hypothetical protein
MRVPHLLWVSAWVVLIALFLRILRLEGSLAWMLAATLFLLLVFEGRAHVLRRAFTDDVPAAVFALAGMYAFVRAERVTPSTSAAVGVCFALAAFCKDALLMFAFVGPVLVAQQVWRAGGPQRWRQSMYFAGVCLLAFALVITPRFVWSMADFGTLLANPIQYWMIAHFYGTGYFAPEHYPYFLSGNTQYTSRVAMAGGVSEAIALTVTGPLWQTFRVLLSFGFLWVGLAVLWFTSRRLSLPWHATHRRLLIAFVVSTVAFSVLFGLGLGDAEQIRYWLVPVTLGLLLIVAQASSVLAEVSRRSGARMASLCGCLAVLLVAAMIEPVELTPVVEPRNDYSTPPLSTEIMREVDGRLRDGDAVLMDIPEGIYFWSMYPEARVVTYLAKWLRQSGPLATAPLIAHYNVQYAVYRADSPGVTILREIGFDQIATTRDEILFRYRGPAVAAAPPG